MTRLFAFLKNVLGDISDNIFSAYPGVRTKGTKNKIGIQEAYHDMGNKGFTWNNFMLQRWTDHNGEEHQVIKDYERNKLRLIKCLRTHLRKLLTILL